MNKLTEQYVIDRIKELRKSLSALPKYEEQTKAENIQYYSDLARIDELLELLPKKHWIKKETDSQLN